MTFLEFPPFGKHYRIVCANPVFKHGINFRNLLRAGVLPLSKNPIIQLFLRAVHFLKFNYLRSENTPTVSHTHRHTCRNSIIRNSCPEKPMHHLIYRVKRVKMFCLSEAVRCWSTKRPTQIRWLIEWMVFFASIVFKSSQHVNKISGSTGIISRADSTFFRFSFSIRIFMPFGNLENDLFTSLL